MRSDYNWDDLGRRIEETVDRAVNSRDFEKLEQTIRQAVETAVDLGGTVRRTHSSYTQTTRRARTVRQNTELRCLYGNTGGFMTKGVLKTVFGGIITFFSVIGSIGSLLLGVFESGMLFGTIPFLAGLAAGGGLIASGVQNIRLVSRFNAYRKLLGSKTTCAIDKLARAVGKTAKFVRGDLNRMFGKGLFLEGHLDREQTMLITSDETYKQFEQARLQLEQHQAQAMKTQADSRLQEVLDRGDAFLDQLHKCNDDIPSEAVSAKIFRMELIVERIFDRAEHNPEIIPDLKKLMDHYLPMTVKLLRAYADMDAQPIQGANIEKSKREIEETLDTLNLAYEKLLDQIFQETAMDVSSDITVLQTLLAQEGLTEDDITRLRN